MVGRDGRVVQGDIVQALQEAGWEVRRHHLRCSASERARSWYWAREMSCGVARRQVACCTEVAQRFLVRAWADCLPTYQNIARRTRGEGPNIYKQVWGDGEEVGGECPLCGGGVETLLHALGECPATLAVRETGLRAIEQDWGTAGEAGWWRELRLLEPSFNPGGEWRGQWGWAGIVPAPTLLGAMGIGPLNETRRALLGRTAIRLAVLASGVWNARCKLVQEVEKGNGVHERKVRAQRSGWVMPRFGMAAPRGRPPKDRDDLSETYKRIKESAEHRAQAKAEHEDWRHHHEEWLRARRQAEREARDRHEGRTVWRQGSILGSLVIMPVSRMREMLQTRAAHRQRRLDGMGRVHPTTECHGDGECVVAGCNNQAMRCTMGCRANALRCVDHAGLSCWGGWRGCDCMIEERRPKGVAKRAWLHERAAARQRRVECLRDLCEARERVWIRARLGDVTAVGWITSLVTGTGGGIIEAYIREEEEEAMVSLLDMEVSWEVIPDDDPEMILESPPGSDDEEDEGVPSPMVRHAGRAFSPKHGCYRMQPDDQEEVQEGGDDGVRVQVQFMDPSATPYAAMLEPFYWGTAVALVEELEDRRVQLAAQCEVSHQDLMRRFQLSEREVMVQAVGQAYLRSYKLPRSAWDAYERHHGLIKELRGVESGMDSLPRYMAAACRGQEGWAAGGGAGWEEVAQVVVRYERKTMQVGGVNQLYGRAYPKVHGWEDLDPLQGVMSLTAMPKQIRNALISFPRPLLVDIDIVKCYPSIMLALARMHGMDDSRTLRLSSFVSDPSAIAEVVCAEVGCEVGAVKAMVKTVISDTALRYDRDGVGWMRGFEEEVWQLRTELISRHPFRDAYRSQPRSDGSVPNVGTVMYRVLTDVEVRVVAAAAAELREWGIRAATYEYDGMKVSAGDWQALCHACQDDALSAVHAAIDGRVFYGQSGGAVRVAVKPMEYGRYREGLLKRCGGTASQPRAGELGMPLPRGGASEKKSGSLTPRQGKRGRLSRCHGVESGMPPPPGGHV